MKKSTRLLFVTLAIPVLAISQTTEPAPAPVPALPPVPVPVVPPVPLRETPMPVPPANTAKPGDAAPVPLPKPEDVPERGKGKGKPDDKGQDQQKKPAPQDPAAILCRQAWKAKKLPKPTALHATAMMTPRRKPQASFFCDRGARVATD
jgi:hypothetical protein